MVKLADQLAALATMSPAQLRQEWERVFRKPAPAISPDLLLRELAYRLQERAQGGLSPSTRQQLQRLCRQFGRDGEVSRNADVTLKPGTRLVRDWHGRSHHVLVVEQGYLYEDRHYRSLSRLASDITGVSWSGPRFFGLKRRTRPEQIDG